MIWVTHLPIALAAILVGATSANAAGAEAPRVGRGRESPVQRPLTEIQGQIERIAGRIKVPAPELDVGLGR